MATLSVYNQQGKEVGKYDIDPTDLAPRINKQLLHDAVVMYEANRRVGTAQTKSRGMVKGSTRKLFRQKGTGRARQGSRHAPQMRGGGVAFGPQVRSHAFSLNKKVRLLGLRTALSDKQREGKLLILENAVLKKGKTAELAKTTVKNGWVSALVIDGAEVDANFARAARNLPGLDVLPQQGANVIDILRRDLLVLTKAAVKQLEARLT